MSIVDKIALVTGASRGIGAAIADALGRAGAIVVGTATTAEGAERISARFADLGIKGRGMALDVTDAGAVVRVVQQIEDEFGPPLIPVSYTHLTLPTNREV